MICSAKIINETPEMAVDLLSKGPYFRVKPDVLLTSFKSAPALIGSTIDERPSAVPDQLEADKCHQAINDGVELL